MQNYPNTVAAPLDLQISAGNTAVLASWPAAGPVAVLFSRPTSGPPVLASSPAALALVFVIVTEDISAPCPRHQPNQMAIKGCGFHRAEKFISTKFPVKTVALSTK